MTKSLKPPIYLKLIWLTTKLMPLSDIRSVREAATPFQIGSWNKS